MTYLHDRPMTRIEDAGYAETMEGRLEEVSREVARFGNPALLARIDQLNTEFKEIQGLLLKDILRD